MNTNNDAQRDLEQRALRNVRGLVDKIESSDELEKRSQKRTLTLIVVVALAAFAAIAGWLFYRDAASSQKPVVIDPAKLPAVKPGPPATR